MGKGRKASSTFRQSPTRSGPGHKALFPALIRGASGLRISTPLICITPKHDGEACPTKLEAPPLSWLVLVVDLPWFFNNVTLQSTSLWWFQLRNMGHGSWI